MRTASRALAPFLEWLIILVLLFSIIWKGGKGIEPAWILGGIAVIVVFFGALPRRKSLLRTITTTVESVETALFSPGARPARNVPSILWLMLLAFLGWSVLSQIFSATANYGLDEILQESALVLLFFWMVRQPVTVNQQGLSFAEKLLFVLALIAIGASAIGVAVYALQPVNRFVGTFFDLRYHTDYWPNAWAEFILLTWPMVAWFTAKMRLVTGTAIFGFVLGALFLSYSRGAFLVFGAQAALLCVFILLPRLITKAQTNVWSMGSKQYLLRLCLAVGCAVLVFFAINMVRAQFHEVESLARKATFTAVEGKSSVNERRDFWEQSWSLSQQRPLFGWGPYSFRFIQPRLQHGVFETSDHPHNVYLKYALERGWPAALLFLIFTGLVLAVALYRLCFAGISPDDPMQLMLRFSVIGVVGVLAHNLIDYNLQFVGIALPFWLLLGLIVSLSWNLHPLSHSLRRLSVVAEVLVAAVLCMTLLWEGRYLVLSSLGRRAEAAGRMDEAIRQYDHARGQAFSRDMHLSRTQVLLDRNRISDAETALADYFAQNSEDPRAWRLKGDIAFLHARYDEALAAYDEGLWRGKYNNLSLLYSVLKTLSIQKNAGALQLRKTEFDQLFQTYADAINGNVHFIALSANVEQLRDIADLLGLLYVSDAPRYKAISDQVWTNATRERERLSARSVGYLW